DGDPLYEVRVRYCYEVDGMIHEGNRLAFGYHASSGRPSHLEIHDRLKATPTVLVRYHPARPALSCLSFGIHRSIVLLFGFALIWLMITFLAHGAFWLSTQPDSTLLNNLATPAFAQPPSR